MTQPNVSEPTPQRPTSDDVATALRLLREIEYYLRRIAQKTGAL